MLKNNNLLAFNYPEIPTMISKEEREYLYELTSNYWTGKGSIIEIGPWLGGSTYCLASGMKDSIHNGHRKLLVYDNFIWRKFMGDRANLKLLEGDSFYNEFIKNIHEFKEYVVPFRASLPDEVVINDKTASKRRQKEFEIKELIKNCPKDPVEILFIDGAKSWTGMKYLLNEFYTYFIPNKTLLVCQDYKYWGMYWVIMIMEMLSHKFEIKDILKSNTVSFILKDKIDNYDINSIPDFKQIDVQSGLDLINSAAKRLNNKGDYLGYYIIKLNAVRFLVHKGKTREAIEHYYGIESKWPILLNDKQLLNTREWFIEQLEQPLRDNLKNILRKRVFRLKRSTRLLINKCNHLLQKS